MIQSRQRSREKERRIEGGRHRDRKAQALRQPGEVCDEGDGIVARKLRGVSDLIWSFAAGQAIGQEEHIEATPFEGPDNALPVFGLAPEVGNLLLRIDPRERRVRRRGVERESGEVDLTVHGLGAPDQEAVGLDRVGHIRSVVDFYGRCDLHEGQGELIEALLGFGKRIDAIGGEARNNRVHMAQHDLVELANLFDRGGESLGIPSGFALEGPPGLEGFEFGESVRKRHLAIP